MTGSHFKSYPQLQGATPWTAEPPACTGPLRFAIAGDNTGLARPGVFAQAMHQIGWLCPDFTVGIGDFIEGYAEDPAMLHRQWDEIEGAVAATGRPFFFMPGNHDLGNDAMLTVWRERFGADHYAFTYKDALFIVLNTEDPPIVMSPELKAQYLPIIPVMAEDPEKAAQMARDLIARWGQSADAARMNLASFGDAQVDFLRETLARHCDIRWTFLFIHRPAWKVPNKNFDRIEALMQDRPYTVFSGHFHSFMHETRKARDYFHLGTTGGIYNPGAPGSMDHIMWVTLTDDGPKYANIRLNGLMDLDGKTGQTLAC